MVQMMSSVPKVKLEIEDSLEDQLGPLPKRSKLDSTLQKCNLETGEFPIPPILYNPLDEPSPLGLSLKKSPSFMDLIEMRLSQENATKLSTAKKKDLKGNAVSTATDKLKASNFPASILKIGTWEYKSRYEGDLVAKCYFAKHKLVWEMLDGSLKNKIEIQWSDIVAIKGQYPDDRPGTLDLVLARQPLFFRETNPQPRKHTLWQATSDFTGGQASIHRKHFLQCPQGLLGKHFEKLIQCDPRLNFLSQQPEYLLKSPYFEPKVSTFDDPSEISHDLDVKCEDGAAIFGVQDLPLSSVPQSSSSESEQRDIVGRAPDNFCHGTPSPSSVMDTHAIEEIRSSGIEEPNWGQIKVAGLPNSVSVGDLMSQIGHCISEQMTAGNPIFSSENLQGRDIVGEIAQYLFNDSQLTSASDEQVMSRVDSLCYLLQKDSATAESLQGQGNDDVKVDGNQRVGKSNSLSSSECDSDGAEDFVEHNGGFNGTSGSKQSAGMSRKDSVGELLLNLPRIASLPQLLFSVSED